MTKNVLGVDVSLEDEGKALLARMFYVHHQEYRKKPINSAPFAPEWAYDYASIAIDYLGVDSAALEDLRHDYK
jgi:hypothetical protein